MFSRKSNYEPTKSPLAAQTSAAKIEALLVDLFLEAH
jgi:hypothetical protein